MKKLRFALAAVLVLVLAGCSRVEPVDAAFGPFEEVQELELEILAADLQIQTGEELHVETDNPHITAEARQGTLVIREARHFDALEQSTVTVCIPEGMEFDLVDMETGAGRITVEELRCRKLELDLGAGEAVFEALYVTGNADIDGGAGQIRLEGGSIRDLEFDMGVGEADLTAGFTGRTDISAGIGALRIRVTGASMEDYTLRLTQGIGQITVNGAACSGTFGSGADQLEISGGVGSVEIVFEEG